MNKAKEVSGRKPVLVYDGWVLALMHNTDVGRTGIFFVAYNTFLQLMKQDMYQVLVYVEDRRGTKKIVEKVVYDLGYQAVRVLGDEELEKKQFDIFLSPFTPPPDFISCSSAAKYMILYDAIPRVFPIDGPSAEFERIEKCLNGNDYYFAISEYTRWDFLRYYPILKPDHIKVSYLAASNSFYCCSDRKKINRIKRKYGVPTDVPYIFSLCTLAPRKNLIHAVKVFAQFIRENDIKDLVFVLGGSHLEEFISVLDHEVEGLGRISSRIIKTGYIEDEDLALLYSGAMFTVYTSLYEGFGLPVLEAMQCGCPVIASNSTSIPEVIGDAGITVDPQDPVALRKAYKKMYTDASFRRECSRKGLERARSFTWEKFIDTVLSGISETWKRAVADNEKRLVTEEQSKRRLERLRHEHPLFGKVWTPERTTIYCLGIPVARKDKSPEKHITRVFGVSLIKRVFNYYVATTYLGPIPIKRRPNYRYIESQIDQYIGQAANGIHSLISTSMEQHRQADDLKVLCGEKLNMLPSYQLIKELDNGTVTLKSELRQIARMMEKREQKEEGAV